MINLIETGKQLNYFKKNTNKSYKTYKKVPMLIKIRP